MLQQQIQLERRMTDRMVQSLLPIFGNRELFAPTEFELERFLANVRGEVENAMQGSGNLVEAEMQVKLPILAPKPELRQQSPRATDVEGEHATPPNKADTSVARLVGARLAQEETASELASVKLELEATRKETLRLQAELVTVKGYRAAAELERDDLVIWTTAAEASRKTFASKADADKAAIERAREEVSQAKTSEARALQRAVTAETELAKSRQERQELETALKVEKEKGALDRDRLCLQANGLYKKQAAVFKKDKEISARLISELKAQVKAAEDTAADVAAIRATENGTIHPPRPQLPQILAGDQPSFEQLQQYYVQKLANLLNAHNASIAENLELRSQNDNILGQLRDTLKDLEKADTDLSDKRGEIKRLNELLNMHGIRGGTWDVKVGSSLAGQAQMQLGLGFRQPSSK